MNPFGGEMDTSRLEELCRQAFVICENGNNGEWF